MPDLAKASHSGVPPCHPCADGRAPGITGGLRLGEDFGGGVPLGLLLAGASHDEHLCLRYTHLRTEEEWRFRG